MTAVRLAPPSPVPVTSNCPAPCVTVVAEETALNSCFTAVTDVVSDGDVTVGAGVAMAGAMEMTDGVCDVT